MAGGGGRSVVVTGLGCVSPLGAGVARTWEALCAGTSGVRALDDEAFAGLPVRIAGRAPEDLDLGAVPAKDARRYDRAVALAVAAAHEAMTDAGLADGGFDPDRAACAIGSGIGGVSTLLENHRSYLDGGARRVSPFFIPMTLANMPAGVVAIRHGLRGPNLCTVTACAASAHALGEAARLVERGDADLAVAGGTEAAVLPLVFAGFARMQALSVRNDEPERASRPFDEARDGFVLGEGAAILVLEAEEHARARGARVRAELAGFGASGDASQLAAPDPEAGGARRCMEAALRDAGVGPSEVDYVNAHATSTPAGDRVEAEALRAVLGPRAEQVAVSSTKGATGHLLGAAGALEALLCVRALEEGELPPTLNLDRPDPACALDHVRGKARSQRARVALSNSFGFGGVNAALVFRR
ncbi:MAG: beta-ketoacyl-ACP synthase II [Myxococcota bacterium]|nr:beta-ketoacyl-ACP synthase II [Myxococcota bacterium]